MKYMPNDGQTINYGEKASKQTNREVVEAVRAKGKLEIFVQVPGGKPVALQLRSCGNKYQAVVSNFLDNEKLVEKFRGTTLEVSLVAAAG